MGSKKSSEKKTGKGRTRNYATVIYPSKEYLERIGSKYDGANGYGSAPEDWKERLSDLHVPVLVSPLHDRDINPDKTIKKPHYHVLFMFDTVKEWETQVKSMFELIGGVGREAVNSARGYARYLCHLDNPEKAQYDPKDIIAFGGADYSAVVHLPTDDMKMLQEVFAFIRVNQIYSLAELLDICSVVNQDWFSMIAMSRAYVVDKYIKSLTWENENSYVRKSIVDPKTGEVIEK
jgi:hypothetical protein